MYPTSHQFAITTRRTVTACLALLLLSTLTPQLSTGFAQGSLTPPGAPAPTMKTLTQIEPRTPISGPLPYTITNAGSYYLTTNLTGLSGTNGITISSGNVTLDLNGFALMGVSGSLKGVYVSGAYTNITVCNGTVSGWGFGVDGYNNGLPRNLVLERLTVSDNLNGLATAAGSVVRDCQIESSANYGIYASGSEVRNCRVGSSGGDVGSIYALGSDVRDCRVDSSGSIGIYIRSGTVSGCSVRSSATSGIYVDAPGCQILNNTCIGNNTLNLAGFAGISINDSNNRVEGNHVTASGAAGIRVPIGYFNNVIIKNTVSGNGANNYVVPGSQVVGPLITTSGTITNSNPWANFSF